MNTVTIQTPAKINLTLDILRKLPNSYHAIRSIVVPIALHDTITVSRALPSAKNCTPRKNRIQLTISGPAASDTPCGHTNIICRATKLFFETLAKKIYNIKIKLHKRIPVRSGLAGGSSDAAATLLALNALHGSPLTSKKLHALALQLGTEVPYFLNPIPALVTGRGEHITPIFIRKQTAKNTNPPFPVTLYAPRARAAASVAEGKKISTKKQYQSIDITQCAARVHDTNKLLAALKTAYKKSRKPLTWDPAWNALLHNDFAQLYRLKKNFALSGSGPTQYKLRTLTARRRGI